MHTESGNPVVGTATPSEAQSGELVVSSFRWQLALIVVAGTVIRVLYTTLVAPWPPKVLTDEFYYNVVPNMVAQGHGFVLPVGLTGRSIPTAAHPPLYPVVLAGLAKLGGTGQEAQRLTGSLFGAGTIAALGLLGRRIYGDRVGLVAAGLAAVYPVLIAADGALMSESLYGLLVALSLLAAYRLLDVRDARRAVALGVVVGLAALTRAEAVLLLGLLLVPVFRRPGGRRAAAIACTALVAVLAPWTVRNAFVFHRFVPIATDSGSAIAGANCRPVYSGPAIGEWSLACIKSYPGSEADASAKMLSAGVHYTSHHLARLPFVGAARLLRVWGLYHPLQQHAEARSRPVEKLGVFVYYVLVALAVYGVVVLRRLRAPMWILITPFLLVSVTAVLIFGAVRFREPAELSLVVLAAIGLEQLWRRYRADRPAIVRNTTPQASA